MTSQAPLDEASEQSRREAELTERVVASFVDAPDPRFREVMSSLVRHLHGFIRDVRLTDAEWAAAIDFLTRVGHITDDRRQEFILLSDVLGASMQTIAVNNEAHGDATEATVFGPFFVEGSPQVTAGGDIAQGAPGQPCWIEGRVTDTEGRPVTGARIEAWEADDDGLYDVQYSDGRVAARGHLYTDDDGRYSFWAVTPTPYPIPDDGPVGDLLRAGGRSPMRTSHLHFMVTADGHRTLVTHIFVRGCEYLGRDSVFGEKDSLVMDFAQHEATEPKPTGRDLGGRDWSSTVFDIVLAPATA